ncbi:MAG: DNA repair protein RecN [Defluviitaleaceae bacterium]|nr:DNA repair protein RecN [Defluviitaleaceae bacterium]
MITHLRIQNVALIDEISVNFTQGLNILTGETGAGKSILVDSINFLLGGRLGRDFIRAGADFAHVEGIVDTDDDEIMLERTMQTATGKSVCKINGRTVTAAILKETASQLVNLHGQHEHQSLLDQVKQLHLLDGFCGEALPAYKNSLEGLLSRYREVNKAFKALTGTGNARQEQIDMWRYQLEEIERAAIKPNEEDELTALKTRLSGLDKLSNYTSSVLTLLDNGTEPQQSATDQVARAVSFVAEISKLDPVRASLHERLIETAAQLTDITSELRNYADELDTDPQVLESIESRLDVIYRLKKKYGQTIEAILNKQKELTQSLNNVENSEAEIKRLQSERRKITVEITTLCDKMNFVRAENATRLSAEITAILNDLGMQNARFNIAITRKTAFAPDGNDQVEFMISPNPGEPEKPLRKIASGGEMSRIMLAIKTVMADSVRTVIFDEVDTGVSGRTAQQVAEKLMNVSRQRQILCITHLPQIAAMADTHFLIEKTTDPATERTATSVNPLSTEAAINELARLTGGAKITPATLQAAREMKEQANGLKG